MSNIFQSSNLNCRTFSNFLLPLMCRTNSIRPINNCRCRTKYGSPFEAPNLWKGSVRKWREEIKSHWIVPPPPKSPWILPQKERMKLQHVCLQLDRVRAKETTLERADFTLQLLLFVTAEKERRMFTIFFLSSFCQLLSPRIQARTGWVRPDPESSDQPA